MSDILAIFMVFVGASVVATTIVCSMFILVDVLLLMGTSCSWASVHLSFEQFVSLFDALPDKWKLDDDSVWFYGGAGYKVRFSFFGALKYRMWYRGLKRRRKMEKQLNDQAAFIADARKNLAEAEEKVQADLRRQLYKIQPDLFERSVSHDH